MKVPRSIDALTPGPGGTADEDLLIGALAFAAPIAGAYCLALLAFCDGRSVPTIPLTWVLTALAGFVATLWFLVRGVPSRPRLAFWLTIGSAIVAGGAVLVHRTFDLTWDGQAWHAYVISRLLHGWNPLLKRLEPAADLFNTVANHYPRLVEVIASEAVVVFGDFDSGRIVQFLMIVPAALLTRCCLDRIGVRPGASTVLALLAVLNPVVLCQLLTYYADGFAYLALLYLCAGLVLLAFEPDRLLVWANLATASILTINAKSTGFGYACFFVMVTLSVLAYRRRWRDVIAFTCVFATIICTTGYSPYVSNLVGFGNPFHPFGSSGTFGRDFLVADQRPRGFASMDRVSRLLVSLSSRPDVGREETHLQSPWSVSWDDLRAFDGPDARTGGFGPLFAGALLLAVATLVATSSRGAALRVWAGPVVVVASVLLHREGWWARYAPQLWMLPIVAAVSALVSAKHLPRILATAVILVMATDAALVGIENVRFTLSASRDLVSGLDRMRSSVGPCVWARDYFPGPRIRLERLGLDARFVGEQECGSGVPLGPFARLCDQCEPPRSP